MAKIFGPMEHVYCEPVADALAHDQNFTNWFFTEIGAIDWVGNSRCLKNEQAQARNFPRFWWKNNFCHESRCTCFGLKGRELDILAVFERRDGKRLALHIECKHPGDQFSKDQAMHYPIRAECWGPNSNNPPRVLDHHEAMTVLLTDTKDRHDPMNIAYFDAVVVFDKVGKFITPYPSVLPN